MRLASASVVIAVVVSCVWLQLPLVADIREPRVLDCNSAFLPTDDVAALVQRYGATNVAKGDIYLGEGFYEVGTILFGESVLDRVEILWREKAALRQPLTIRVRGTRSNWRTAAGVTLGDRLLRVEAVNGRPFRLAGFGWDYGGTQMSWAGGRLEGPSDRPCSLRVRFGEVPGNDQRDWSGQVSGDREFSSGHSAMQALNPEVIEMFLEFKKAG